jgi:hypothetical protein
MFNILPLTSAALRILRYPRIRLGKRSPDRSAMESPHLTTFPPEHQTPDVVSAEFSGRLCSRCAQQLVGIFKDLPHLNYRYERSFDTSYIVGDKTCKASASKSCMICSFLLSKLLDEMESDTTAAVHLSMFATELQRVRLTWGSRKRRDMTDLDDHTRTVFLEDFHLLSTDCQSNSKLADDRTFLILSNN